jgi:L-rhamnose-H+ transport protein
MNELTQATTNPALGVLIFAIGGLAGAVFYLPFKKVRNWAWESYWLVYALFGLLIVPWILTFIFSSNVFLVLKAAPGNEKMYCYLCGAAWGVGGLTWGLMLRYLGVGLGLAFGCGICSAAGTLIPKLLRGEFGQLFQPGAGIISFAGVIISLIGIVLIGMAGMSKEKELPEAQKKKAVAEFNFRKGLMAALFSGLMSSAMGLGLVGGPKIQALARTTAPVTSATWAGLPVLVVVLLGGFTVNFLWCLYLNFKNKTVRDYAKAKTPLLANLVFAGIAGAIWCSQFVCFKTGEPAMGPTAYVGWALLMACQILFGTIVGILLGEWKGTSGKTRTILAAGLLLLVLTSVVSGYSSKMAQNATAAEASDPAIVAPAGAVPAP